MDSFIRLPKGTQKKTMEFMEKFRTNPKPLPTILICIPSL